MDDQVKLQMKQFISQAAQLSKEAGVEFKNKNYADGKRKMRQAREAANNFQRLYQNQTAQTTP